MNRKSIIIYIEHNYIILHFLSRLFEPKRSVIAVSAVVSLVSLLQISLSVLVLVEEFFFPCFQLSQVSPLLYISKIQKEVKYLYSAKRMIRCRAHELLSIHIYLKCYFRPGYKQQSQDRPTPGNPLALQSSRTSATIIAVNASAPMKYLLLSDIAKKQKNT